ncbi:hypothetical protein [Tenacibaculum sp. M341]|uniref:hypothetical protein n=1 Tax=Tenacibaculum sp. M341 TaxID=2530339 RepID=UPI0010512C39|nr:hypothetical protein [Tenacibaculum sp. M341]TCI84911.1 hypothetical protein EYW44_19430 [Tenacibaculum sp. M341]
MENKEKAITNVKLAIEGLIKAGTTYDIEALDAVYHNNLEVSFMDSSGNVSISNKKDFKKLFEVKRANNEEYLNSWAHFNHINVHKNKAHVLITRKVNLTGKEDTLTLSIDLVLEEEKWQVIREVIFTHPVL